MKKYVVKENKLKTFYLNFTKNNKNNTDQRICWSVIIYRPAGVWNSMGYHFRVYGMLKVTILL